MTKASFDNLVKMEGSGGDLPGLLFVINPRLANYEFGLMSNYFKGFKVKGAPTCKFMVFKFFLNMGLSRRLFGFFFLVHCLCYN